MTKKQIELKKYLIKMVHTLKKEFFLDEECRYAYMQGKFGKTSTKDMSIDELREMLKDMGFEDKRKRVARTKRPVAATKEKATQRQLDTITSIWNSTARVKTTLALRAFIARVLKQDYYLFHLWYLNKDEASKVIYALRQFQKNSKLP